MAAVVGPRDADILSPERAEACVPTDQRVIAENRIATYEERFATIDERAPLCRLPGPLRDGDRSVIGSFGISHDITEKTNVPKRNPAPEPAYAARGVQPGDRSLQVRG